MLLAAGDSSKSKGSVAGGAVIGIAIAVVLWFFASRGHRWPKWFLLVAIVIALGAQVAFLDGRSAWAVVDLVALAVLLRGWSRIEQQEGSWRQEGAEETKR